MTAPSRKHVATPGVLILLGLAMIALTLLSDALLRGRPLDIGYKQVALAVFGIGVVTYGIALYFVQPEWIAPDSIPSTMITLFVVSLSIRLILTLVVIHYDVITINDEVAYLGSATGFDLILRSGQITPEAIDLLYGTTRVWAGARLPFWPFLISLGYVIFGYGPPSARLVATLVSALTTPVIYLFTLRLANKRAALLAAIVHILLPNFLGWSHLLWSETLYSFLIVLNLLFVTYLVTAQRTRMGIAFGLAAGVSLGLAGLTRAIILPQLVLVPLWILFRVKDRGVKFTGLTSLLVSTALILAPWQMLVIEKENTFVLLSPTSYMNLYVTTYGETELNSGNAKKGPLDFARQYAEQQGIPETLAWRELAQQSIRQHPFALIKRIPGNVRQLFSANGWVMRFLLSALYPPIPQWLMVLIIVLLFTTHVLFMGTALAGYLSAPNDLRYRDLLLLRILLSMPVLLLTVTVPRFNLPNMVVSLPAVGVGVGAFGTLSRGKKAAAIGFALLVGISALYLLTDHRVSSYYAATMSGFNHILGQPYDTADNITIRVNPEEQSSAIRVSFASGSDFYFDESGSEVVIQADGSETSLLVIRSTDATRTPQLVVSTLDKSESHVIEPINPESWQTYRSTGLAGVDYCWHCP